VTAAGTLLFLSGDIASVKLKVDGEVAQVKKGNQTFPLSRVVWHNCLVELTAVEAAEDIEAAAAPDKKQAMLSVAQAGGQEAADQTTALLDALAAAKKKLDEIQKATLHEQGRAKTCVGYAYKYAVEEYEKKRPVTSAEQEKMAALAREFKLKAGAPGEAGAAAPAGQGLSRNARRAKRRRERQEEGQHQPQQQQQQQQQQQGQRGQGGQRGGRGGAAPFLGNNNYGRGAYTSAKK